MVEITDEKSRQTLTKSMTTIGMSVGCVGTASTLKSIWRVKSEQTERQPIVCHCRPNVWWVFNHQKISVHLFFALFNLILCEFIVEIDCLGANKMKSHFICPSVWLNVCYCFWRIEPITQLWPQLSFWRQTVRYFISFYIQNHPFISNAQPFEIFFFADFIKVEIFFLN